MAGCFAGRLAVPACWRFPGHEGQDRSRPGAVDPERLGPISLLLGLLRENMAYESMAISESEKSLRSSMWIKFGCGLFLFAAFGTIGIGALSESRWEAIPLALIMLSLSVYSFFRAVTALLTATRRGN